MADPLAADERALVGVLSLNNAHAEELSWLDMRKLQHLVGEAFLALQEDDAEAFIIAFDQDADYDSENFLWFRSRYERFVYVDRVVVSVAARGRGLARRLYETLFQRAREAGHAIVVCEVNAVPPNPASDAFHASLGFAQVGEAGLKGGAKSVRYFARPLA